MVVIFSFETYAIALSNEQRILICYEPVYLFTLTLVILIDSYLYFKSKSLYIQRQ